MTWEDLYNLFGIKEFIYFISSPVIQEQLLPIKLVCFGFTLFLIVILISSRIALPHSDLSAENERSKNRYIPACLYLL
jgi:hypothetical protein